MKLNNHFVKHTVDGEALLVPVSGTPFYGLIQGNKSVDAILECLKTDTTEEKIVDTLCRQFKGDRAIIQEDVADVISRLKAIGAIDD